MSDADDDVLESELSKRGIKLEWALDAATQVKALYPLVYEALRRYSSFEADIQFAALLFSTSHGEFLSPAVKIAKTPA